MGGDSYCSSPPSTEDASLSSQDSPHKSIHTSVPSEDDECLSHKLENGSVIKGVRVSDSGEFPDVGRRKTSIDEAAERQRLKVYTEILRSYEDLQPRIDRLEEARNKILSYTPASLADKTACMDLREYDVPDATSLLLIGPKGSGKSSLVNKISWVIEDDMFLPARAQVSCSSSPGDRTYFLHEYMIPRNSGSFCLYDTRGLSVDSSENLKMIKRWMKKGVRHGELIRRKSDSMTLKAQLKCKARRSFFSDQVRPVDFVIFVVNGLSLLESMNSTDETKKGYSQMIAMNFNNPLLSFKDDKPAIVVTHGDLLPLPDRVRVRAYLGELLGVPPTGQIFDIPEDNDPATTSAIFDMLLYCLDRADRNLPPKDLFLDKVHAVADLLFWIAVAVAVVVTVLSGILSLHCSRPQTPPASLVKIPIKIPDPHHGQQQAPPAPPVKIPSSQPQASPAPPLKIPSSQSQAPPAPPVKIPSSQPQAPPAPPVKIPSPHRSQPQAPPTAPPSKILSLDQSRPPAAETAPLEVEWHKIRHLWAAETPPFEVEWHKIRHLWSE